MTQPVTMHCTRNE